MLLSVIIPSYQHSRYVISCITAAINIPVREKEILVIDDGSVDNSPELIKNWISAHSNGNYVRFISHENRGLVSVLNEGLAAVSGEYVYIVASDDVLIPDGLWKILDALIHAPHAGFAIGNALAFHGDAEHPQATWLTYAEPHERFFRLSPFKRSAEIFLNYPVPLLIQASVFKRSALMKVGGWDPELAWDDFPLFVKLLDAHPEMNTDFIYRPKLTIVKYRQHEFNTYKNFSRQVFMIIQTLKSLCPEQLQDKAATRVYIRFSLSALKQKKFIQALQLIKTSIVDHGSVITLKQLFFIIWSRIKDKLFV